MPKRTRLAKGVYADAFGISVVYQAAGKSIETRFPRGASLDRLTRWRERQIQQQKELHPAAPRQSLTRDVVRYLQRLKGLPGYKSEKAHLRAWLHLFRDQPRRTITPAMIELAVARWRQEGYAARTIRHRCRVLRSLYQRLDGKSTWTPLDEIPLPAKPKPRPVPVSDQQIQDVALRLLAHEITGTMRTAKTRARFLVLATHAQRPAEVQRAQREDVDLERRLWAVRGAKGGYNVIVPLNEAQVAAWQLFATAQAWGTYDTRSFAKTLRRAGWPKGIRPYNLRHSTGFALSARGVDLGDIQALFGHTSPETTRAFYVPGLLERLTSATAKLDGRFGVTAFQAAPPPRTKPPRTGRGDTRTRASLRGN